MLIGWVLANSLQQLVDRPVVKTDPMLLQYLSLDVREAVVPPLSGQQVLQQLPLDLLSGFGGVLQHFLLAVAEVSRRGWAASLATLADLAWVGIDALLNGPKFGYVLLPLLLFRPQLAQIAALRLFV
jgi:hypothetical protein